MVALVKACAYCAIEFTPRRVTQKYCTRQCGDKGVEAKRREKKNAWSRAKYKENPALFRERHDRWYWGNRANSRIARRRAFVKEKYGLTLEQVKEMVTRQGGLCALCHEPLPERFHIDHDHGTGAVRGLLHDQCNRGLSLFGDNVRRIELAVVYLNGYSDGSTSNGILR